MKNLNHFILERLKITKDSKLQIKEKIKLYDYVYRYIILVIIDETIELFRYLVNNVDFEMFCAKPTKDKPAIMVIYNDENDLKKIIDIFNKHNNPNGYLFLEFPKEYNKVPLNVFDKDYFNNYIDLNTLKEIVI